MNTGINHNQVLYSHPKLPKLDTIGLKISPQPHSEPTYIDNFQQSSIPSEPLLTYEKPSYAIKNVSIQASHNDKFKDIFMNTIKSSVENGIYTVSGEKYQI